MKLKYIQIATLLLLYSCKTSKVSEQELAYTILNSTFNTYYNYMDSITRSYRKKEIVIKIDSEFNSFLLSKNIKSNFTTINSRLENDLWVIDYKEKIKKCNNTLEFNLSSNAEYYVKQAKYAPLTIDFEKIKNKHIELYSTEIKLERNKKNFEANKIGLTGKALEALKQNYIQQENGYFKITYPLISKNKKLALVYLDGPGQLWILENKNHQWKRKCFLQLIYY